MATNGSFAHQDQYKGAADAYSSAAPSIDATQSSASNSNLPKDEVGWYFVEQYYTTLSKQPDKLHLFYSKRSQFVYGLEAEVANVSVGRQAIAERIKQLDFQDCKVRVSNVDSQGSNDNIVIQVIGETSNKAAEPKKFVQTFVLAQQPTGYFVLNDMMRYIAEDDATEPAASDAPAAKSEHHAQAPATADADVQLVKPANIEKAETSELDTTVIEQKLETAAPAKAVAGVNGGNAVSDSENKTERVAAETSSKPDPETAAREIAEEDVKVPEKPADPSPTPIAKDIPSPAEPTVAEPAAPPKPMTWASRAAAAAGPRPVVPLPKTATPPAASQGRAPAPAAAAAATAAAAAAPAASSQNATATAEAASKDSSGWQTAGADSKRQNRPQSISAVPGEKDSTLGYVKYVTDKVQDADLKAALAAHGELSYFDINRQKNCAFVEYKTQEGYQAAISANPHIVNGENIVVEPRRPKATAYGGSSYGSRGSTAGRGRGGFDASRGGQGNSRGNYSGQNRGRGGAPRGRGGSQVPAA